MLAAEGLAPLPTARLGDVDTKLGLVITLAEEGLSRARSDDLLDLGHLGARQKSLKAGSKGPVPLARAGVKLHYQGIRAKSEGKPRC